MDDDGHQDKQTTDSTEDSARQPSDELSDSSAESDTCSDSSKRNHEHPAPWLAFDFDGFETDDRAPSLDENAPSLDEEMVGETGFDPSDADDPDHWQWLKELNNGRGESDRSSQLHQAGIQRDLDIVCDRLGCTDHQQERAQWLLDNVDIQAQLLPSGPIEIAIIGVVSMVIDEDRTQYARGSVDDITSVMRDESFETLLDDFDIDMSRIHDVRQRLRDTEVYESPN